MLFCGLAEGGIPIGSVLVLDNKMITRRHKQRVQKGSTVLHAEMDCLENAGRMEASESGIQHFIQSDLIAICAVR